jgi:hypothetical protein
MKAPLLMIAVLVAAEACGSVGTGPIKAGPVDHGQGTLTDARKRLEGRWALEAFELMPPGRSPITLNGQGTLEYDDFGNLRMEIRADQQSADLLRAAGVELGDGDRISSDGRTVIDLQNKTIAYVVQGQPAGNQALLGTARLRYWDIQGEVLVLTTKDDNGQPTSIGRWRRQ